MVVRSTEAEKRTRISGLRGTFVGVTALLPLICTDTTENVLFAGGPAPAFFLQETVMVDRMIIKKSLFIEKMGDRNEGRPPAVKISEP